MRVFLLSILSYFCFSLNVSAQTWESPRTYVGEDGSLVAESKDEFYYREKKLNDPAYASSDRLYRKIIDYIRTDRSVTTDDLDRLITEKYNDDSNIYAYLGFFFSSFNGQEEEEFKKAIAALSATEREQAEINVAYSIPTADEIDYHKAEHYFLKAIEKINDPYDRGLIEMNLAILYDKPNTDLYSPDKKIIYLERASNAGVGHAQFQLGAAYLYGENVEQDSLRAYELIKRAADENDHYYAIILLTGIMYERKDGGLYPLFPYDNAELIHYAQKGIDLYKIYGSYGLIAKAYEYGGKNLQPDHTKAFENAKKCVEMSNYLPCHKMLGEYYRDGIGTEIDIEQARIQFQAAADMGDTEAEQLLQKLPVQ